MKTYKGLLSIIGAIVVIIAAVAAIVVFKDQIIEFFETLKDKLCCCKEKALHEDYSDFADV